jgi:predicted branched-subunit amino acid permease
VVGHLVAEVEPLGLDFVLPAMFIGLLVMQIRQHTQLWAALLAGTMSVVLLLMGFRQWHVIMATFIGASFGAWIEGWKKI